MQRSRFNWANDCSFTLNVGLVKAADYYTERLTVAVLKKVILFERSGSICYGRDEWYRFSLKDRKDEAYIRRVILTDLDRILSYLHDKS